MNKLPFSFSNHHYLDLNQIDYSQSHDFILKVVNEFENRRNELLTQAGLLYSFQNPENYLNMIRLFFEPACTLKYFQICNKETFDFYDPPVFDFVETLFRTVAWSPLINRMIKLQHVDIFEFSMFSCSYIFNTAPVHAGDPRHFSKLPCIWMK